MQILIKSTNEHLYSILNKNPNTDDGLYLKPLKNGVIIGFTDLAGYGVVFQDDRYSFLRTEDNQIDFRSYCFPIVGMHCLSELFGELLKEDPQNREISWLGKTVEEVDGPTDILIPQVWADSRFLDKLERDLGVEFEPRFNAIHSLKVKGETCVEAINKAALTLFFLAATNRGDQFLDESMVNKYVRILGNIKDCPYYLYYLFTILFFKKANLEKLERGMKKNLGLYAKLVKEDTNASRKRFVREHLEGDKIVDFGCGEFAYNRLFQKAGVKHLISVDPDPEVEEIFIHKTPPEGVGWEFRREIDSYSLKGFSVVSVEVLEHMSLDDALETYRGILEKSPDQVLLTTPNKTFNQFFGLGEDPRRDDHLNEMTRAELHQFIAHLVSGTPYKAKFYDLGDIINGEPVTFGVVLECHIEKAQSLLF